MNTATGGVCAPKGFTASGTAAQIKGPASEKKDCALIFSESPCALAGMFTTNRVKAAPVLWNEDLRGRGTARAVFINSGNANACTGENGMDDVRATAACVADRVSAAPEEVCVASTGVIGVPLPMDRILTGVDQCAQALSGQGSGDAALAIMTTDTVPKEMAVEVVLPEGRLRIGGIAKGAGMIAPNMATMIAVLTTDAAIEAGHLQRLLAHVVSRSFNCICVDNDMSTSDTVLCLANGQAESLLALVPGTPAFDAFAAALEHLCVALAKALVKDGEGASKFVEIQIEGAETDAEALRAARSIASSQLCKTAFFGQDPNWGRIACAVGYAKIAFAPEDLAVWLDDVQVMAQGQAADYQEEDAAAVMEYPEFTLRVSLGAGPGRAVFWTSDLSHDYVSINADYRS